MHCGMTVVASTSFLLFTVLTVAAVAAESRPPNVIVIVADQLRYQSVGYAGDKLARTPNLDRLAAEGINFRQFVANTPVCSAFRGSFLTGKYASTTGVAVNELRLNPNHDSIAHMLARNTRLEADLVDQLFNSSEKRLARTLLLLARYGHPRRAG